MKAAELYFTGECECQFPASDTNVNKFCLFKFKMFYTKTCEILLTNVNKSATMALGSWLLALGSWLLALGSWLLALGIIIV